MRRGSGLKRRFIQVVLAVFALTVVATLALAGWVMEDMARGLGEKALVQHALRERDRIEGLIRQEVALSLKMADSPLLHAWARDEGDPRLKRLALAELASYRQAFRHHNTFLVLQPSLHYYFMDASAEAPPEAPAYTVSPDKDSNAWYFATVAQGHDFSLNVDRSEELDIVQVWINALMRGDDGTVLGLAGSGMKLDRFIAEMMALSGSNRTVVLFDEGGAIQAHPDATLIDQESLLKTSIEQSRVFDLYPDAADALRTAQQRLHRDGAEVARVDIPGASAPLVGAMVHLDSIGWYLLIVEDFSELADWAQFLPLVAVMGLGFLAFPLVLTWHLNRQVLRPVEGLAAAARAMGGGDYGARAPTLRDDELGDLGHTFNEMAHMVALNTDELEQRVQQRTAELGAANRELRTANDEIGQSIAYARMIQRGILPDEDTLAALLGDHYVLWRPREGVGGDFLFVRNGAEGVWLGVADCTGHGVPGALMTMSANAVLQHVLAAAQPGDPAGVLATFNGEMRRALHRQQAGPTDGPDNGLDLALCHWAPRTQTLTFAGARIPLLHARRGETAVLPAERHSLGYRRSDTHAAFRNRALALAHGDAVFMISDGVLDQAGGEKGFGISLERVRAVLVAHGGQGARAQGDALERLLAEHQGDHPQRDDMTVFGFSV